MGKLILDSGWMAREKDKVHFFGQMGAPSKDNGRMAKKMEYMYLLMHIMAKVLNNNGKLDSLLEN
jgi:hypothetical protein